jgi:hypothetical protein
LAAAVGAVVGAALANLAETASTKYNQSKFENTLRQWLSGVRLALTDTNYAAVQKKIDLIECQNIIELHKLLMLGFTGAACRTE